ncbi:hypothetical protein UYSO10_5017 [Kosakonia radicincitans]|nr:hypothetical protein UYSO10_5017 [Kosakonia radicincitans]
MPDRDEMKVREVKPAPREMEMLVARIAHPRLRVTARGENAGTDNRCPVFDRRTSSASRFPDVPLFNRERIL